MDIDSVLQYINEFIQFVKPVGGLVKDWFDNMYLNIPEFEKIMMIIIGFLMISIVLDFLYRAVND